MCSPTQVNLKASSKDAREDATNEVEEIRLREIGIQIYHLCSIHLSLTFPPDNLSEFKLQFTAQGLRGAHSATSLPIQLIFQCQQLWSSRNLSLQLSSGPLYNQCISCSSLISSSLSHQSCFKFIGKKCFASSISHFDSCSRWHYEGALCLPCLIRH